MRNINIRPLDPARVAQAFPLLHLSGTSSNAVEWTAYASQLLKSFSPKECGILVAEDDKEVILGLAEYRIDQDCQYGRSMIVQTLTAVDLVPRAQQEILGKMLESLSDLARQQGCEMILTEMPQGDLSAASDWMVPVLKQDGHHLARQVYCKPVATRPK